MEKSDSAIQFHRLMEAMDKWHIQEEDREKLLSLTYSFGYDALKVLYQSQVKRHGGKRNGR